MTSLNAGSRSWNAYNVCYPSMPILIQRAVRVEHYALHDKQIAPR